MVTTLARQVEQLSPVPPGTGTAFHPLIASAPDAFTRLARAWYWYITDTDHRHARHWRDQITRAESELRAAHPIPAAAPASVQQSRRATIDALVTNAMLQAWATADKRPFRGSVPVTTQ